MLAPDFRIAAVDDLEALMPLVRAYHDFEDDKLNDESRRSAVARLLGDNELGIIWLIDVNNIPVGYVVLCFGYSVEFAGGDAFVDELFRVVY